MNRINPFDNLYFKQGIGQQEGVNSASQVDEKNTPQKADETQGINNIPKSDEDDFVDISDMVDDSEDFASSDMNFNNDNKTDEVSSTEAGHNENQEQNNQNKDDIKEEVSQFVNDLLEKQNIN